MSAGTLTLTNNSAAVAGSWTAFTTEVAAGDFIVVTVGGVPYTLPVKSVESGTALTLVSNYTGPTQSGAAWSAVPRVALNMVTAALVAQSAEALRGLNYDKKNWQQFFTADGDVTITLPDNSQTTGPSAKKLINSVAGKADSTDARLDTINGKSGGVVDGEIALTRSATENISNRFVFTTIANAEGLTAWAERHDFADGTNRQILNLGSVSGVRKAVFNAEGGILCKAGINNFSALRTGYFIDYESGPVALYIDSTRTGSIQLVTTSDKFLKKEIEYLSDKNVMGELSATATALSEVMEWKPATFKFKKRGIIPESETKLGFIANDLIIHSPECVKGKGLEEGFDENNAADAYSLDETAMIAKLTLSIQELQKQITELQGSKV
ncbi:tail fiber domain-containing protein [Citrobacter freundii]|uniref:tail fiber domain-containing protein n=1 Tax=Citrobacter freundii TaxID=546 RepID=UPI0018834F0D|nr:tail fiber domain-containing protein [Citrobacter freundii]MBE9975612.1 tail fiber domain-containing protein [Citrobacter freundii]MBE9985199.1 tail fiber domain-containing protein [Citrobacter freundii]MBF0064567.1 tail fiber domain-containing protein [Citrobacter freundii]